MSHLTPRMDIDDALTALAQHRDDDPAVTAEMCRIASTVIADFYDMKLCSGDCGGYDEDGEGWSNVDLDHLAWAATQARQGAAAEACEFLARALAEYPDALTALDLIKKRLTP